MNAAYYARLGWHVIPIIPGQKRPYVKWHKATTDPDAATELFATYPSAQIGVLTGPSKLAVIDRDTYKDDYEAFPLPSAPSWRMKSPSGGWQDIYHDQEGSFPTDSDIVSKGIDRRGVGGLIVVPSDTSPGRVWIQTEQMGEIPPGWGGRGKGRRRNRPASKSGRKNVGFPELLYWEPEACPLTRNHDRGENQKSLSIGHLDNGRLVVHCNKESGECTSSLIREALVDTQGYSPDDFFGKTDESGPWDADIAAEAAEAEAAANDDPGFDPAWHPLAIQRSTSTTRRRQRIPDQRLAEAWTMGRADLAAMPDPEFLVPGRIQTNAFAQLAGPSGLGKSFLALSWALDLTSDPLHDPIGLHKPRRVLILAAEGVSGYLRRIEAWEKETGRTWNDDRLRLRPDVPTLLEDTLDDYVSLVAGSGPWDMVVIDTLSRAIAGQNENAPDVMSAAVKGAQRLQDAARGTVLLVHHFGWEGTRQRGSTALYAACDNVVYVKPVGSGLCVSTDKLKDGEPCDAEKLILTPVARSCVLRPMVVDAADAADDQIRKRIMELQAKNPDAAMTSILTAGFNSKKRTRAKELWHEMQLEL